MKAEAVGASAAVAGSAAFAAATDRLDAALAAEIDRHSPRLVALAGFMRILTPGFVAHYTGRLMNIHPSLLPAFPGLDTHRRALAAGVKVHGCSVHFVSEQLDHGPIIVQAAVPVRPGDTPALLAARDCFYTGELAEAMLDFQQRHDGLLRREAFATTIIWQIRLPRLLVALLVWAWWRYRESLSRRSPAGALAAPGPAS